MSDGWRVYTWGKGGGDARMYLRTLDIDERRIGIGGWVVTGGG